MELEIMTQIQQRKFQDTALAEQERNQQPSDASVPVEERVDRFKLAVRQPADHQRRKSGALMEELLKVIERVMHLVNRRRHERSRRQRAIGRANPVLATAEFSGRAVGTAHPFEQLSVNLPDEPQGKR